MTDAHDPELDALDQAARAASDGLHAHVHRSVEPELLLTSLPPTAPSHSRARLLAAAAVVALFIGSVAVVGNGPEGDERSRLELDEDGNPLPPPTPGVLTPLGPSDGRDSIQLPVTVEPNVDLGDGETVTVSGPGFVAGERVGIVQCASEAGEGNGGTKEERLGIDGCDTGGVAYADADADGVATGTFRARRVLTTPATGTVDCAAEAQRCIVAMGALNDYDRSGGHGVAFVGGGEPIDIPTLTVSPAEGLSDGDVVHVEGEGFAPGPVNLQICSIDPAGCWATGQMVELSSEDVEDLGFDDGYGEYQGVGLLANGGGQVSGDVEVWRFLPGATPSSYVDCAVSRCSLRVYNDFGGYSPPPAALQFTPGGSGPTPPAIAAAPTRDIGPGDEVVVRGRGFQPGDFFHVSLCVAPVGASDQPIGCLGTEALQEQIDEDGGFAMIFEVPDLSFATEGRSYEDGGSVEDATTTTCASPDCGPAMPSIEEICDGVNTECFFTVEAYREGFDLGPPRFAPAPIPVTVRR